MKNLTGKHFGSLTVVAQSDEQKARRQWECRCICGATVVAFTGNLLRYRSNHCTCARRALRRAATITHNLTKTPEHDIWCGIRKRCFNVRAKAYAMYGGRGITLDPRWNDFAAFLADMGPRPSRRHTVERKDSDGPYSRDNCLWATMDAQNNNKSNNTILALFGRSQTLARWAREVGLKPDTLSARLVKGWSVEKAITTPAKKWTPRAR